MSQPASIIEQRTRAGPAPEEIFGLNAAREAALARLLMLYVVTGLFFMLLPGTFLGVWNLIIISSHRAATFVSPAWIQAHGQAQIFGWIGTFILGIGFYSIPKLRHKNFGLWIQGTAWGLWTCGVAMRWLANVYLWHWRILLPLSASLELVAFLIFFRTIFSHRPQARGKNNLEEWIVVVIAGTLGLLLTLGLNLGITIYLALKSMSPVIPAGLDQNFLVLQAWGFLVPFVWGFSAKWLPIFLGLQPIHGRLLWWAVALNSLGVLSSFLHLGKPAALFLLCGIGVAIHALKLFRPPARPGKIKGVHSSFPVFVRIAYAWALVAAALGVWAALTRNPIGIAGASRHALTVGFLAMMVFAIGQRVLPAFAGVQPLFSTKLMFIALLLLLAGCSIRVSAEVLAYQGFLRSAWSWLPVSAVAEMCAVTAFAANLLCSFATKPHPE